MLKYELKKIFYKRINQVALGIALVLAIAFSCFAVGEMRYSTGDGETHSGIMAGRRLAADKNRWRGKLTEERIAEIARSRKELGEEKFPGDLPNTEYGKTVQSYEDILWFVMRTFIPGSYDISVVYPLADADSEGFYTAYKRNLLEYAKEYGKTPEQLDFLEKQFEKIEMPFTYAAKDSWDTMLMYAETYGIVLAVIIGFLAAGIFAEDFRTGAEAVFFAAKYGRTKATRNKIAAGMLMATVIYWVGIGILSFISFGIMGVSGFFTPYQLTQPYSIYWMTYGEHYLLILLAGYIASLLGASLSMLTAAKMHTANVAVCVPFFLFCMMPFIGRALSSLTTLFRLTPDALINIIECAKRPYLFQVGNVVFRQIPFVLLFYFIVSILLLPFVYKVNYQYGIKGKCVR